MARNKKFRKRKFLDKTNLNCALYRGEEDNYLGVEIHWVGSGWDAEPTTIYITSDEDVKNIRDFLTEALDRYNAGSEETDNDVQ